MRVMKKPVPALLAALALAGLMPLGACSSKPDPAVIEAMKRQQAEAAKARRDAATRQQADKAFEGLDKDMK